MLRSPVGPVLTHIATVTLPVLFRMLPATALAMMTPVRVSLDEPFLPAMTHGRNCVAFGVPAGRSRHRLLQRRGACRSVNAVENEAVGGIILGNPAGGFIERPVGHGVEIGHRQVIRTTGHGHLGQRIAVLLAVWLTPSPTCR